MAVKTLAVMATSEMLCSDFGHHAGIAKQDGPERAAIGYLAREARQRG
ncbi:MAG: hypothetical protein KC432_02425 [Thermomicrobiales bacterium]|nr:hypothetical protein [Thermomicrobiales bacterium]